jgi:heparan-alpha-glucosaminide N-acetyltransferase
MPFCGPLVGANNMEIIAQKAPRILSIDIMRGLTLFLMLFVNDLYEPGVPKWLMHTEGSTDGMGLADWVFPGFLFMVGMAIPYAITSRRNKGESTIKIFSHIILRTLSLLLIGILMLNVGRLQEELSGINRNLWAVLMYICVFLIWNIYPKNEKKEYLFVTLRMAGVMGLIALVNTFRSGDVQNPGWLEVGWWGILGLIGWGYFVAASACLFLNSRLWSVVFLWIFFIGLNILSQLGLTGWLNFLNPVFGVILDGNVPSIVLAGLTVSLILSQKELSLKSTAMITAVLGLTCLGFGFFLRNWFILSKIYGTPSWAMVCSGISMLLYALLFFLIDIKRKSSWAVLFGEAGKNSLTTYLAPDVIYFVCWGTGFHIFFYKQDANQLLAVTGSLGWAVAMIGFSMLLSRINIRLKL